MITRKNFGTTLCIVYTVLVLSKLILEAAMGYTDTHYTLNLLFMFGISFAAVFLLSLHSLLQNIPLLFLMIGQYLLLLLFACGGLWLVGMFSPIHPEGYWDIFISISIPYGIGATIYSIGYFKQLKKMNHLLKEIQNKNAGNRESHP